MDGDELVGLAVSAATLSQGVDAVLTHVHHEAAHVLCWRRGTPETATRGVYHTGVYLSAAEDVGMTWPTDAPRVEGKGWATPVLTSAARTRAADVIGPLTSAIAETVPLLHDAPPRPGSISRLTIQCACVPSRLARISATTLDRGPIICGVCSTEFKPQ
jgi:hypothetical protein